MVMVADMAVHLVFLWGSWVALSEVAAAAAAAAVAVDGQAAEAEVHMEVVYLQVFTRCQLFLTVISLCVTFVFEMRLAEQKCGHLTKN